MLATELPQDWKAALTAEFSKDYFKALAAFVARERAAHRVFPPAEEVFTAYRLTPFADVRVVILGQDPYHGDGQAHGLSFSVKRGVPAPPSLANIYKELRADLGCSIPNNGFLEPWARQGVLLLNAVLTVRAHAANSHKGQGWEQLTDATIKALSARAEPVVFALWGNYARKKARIVDAQRHVVIEGAHPSPLSAKLWFGSRPFSQINRALAGHGQKPIDWQIPDL